MKLAAALLVLTVIIISYPARAIQPWEVMHDYDEFNVSCSRAAGSFNLRVIWDGLLNQSEVLHRVDDVFARIRKIARCEIGAAKVSTVVTPVITKQAPSASTLVIVIQGANLEGRATPAALLRAENNPQAFINRPRIEIEPSGEWKSSRISEDELLSSRYIGPGSLLVCAEGSPTASIIKSKLLIQRIYYACPAINGNTSTLAFFGLGEFASWGEVQQTNALGLEDGAYLALEQELYESLLAILGNE